MKRILTATLMGSMILSAGAAFADPQYNPDCHLDSINQSIDAAIAQIKSSPAAGQAGGHYGKAVKDLEHTKKQLEEGCVKWNKDNAKAAPAK
jgi:hypothetical protein